MTVLTMQTLHSRDDPGDDSDPCGDDVCSITPLPRPSHTSTSGSSRSLAQSRSSSPTPSPSTGASGGGSSGGKHGGGGDNADSRGQTKRGFNKSAIGGIVIGILALILIFAALFLWLRRRRQQQAASRLQSVGTPDGSAGDMRLLPGSASVSLSPTSQVQPGSTAVPLLSAPGANHTAGYATMHSSYAQHDRSPSETTLPNPYDGVYTSPQLLDHPLPPTPRHIELADEPRILFTDDAAIGIGAVGLISSSVSQSLPTWRKSTTMHSEPTSHVSSIVSGSSNGGPSDEASLLGELASYQKRLESHHRKDSEDAVAGMATSQVPTDPPPIYSPTEGRREHVGSHAEHSGQEARAA